MNARRATNRTVARPAERLSRAESRPHLHDRLEIKRSPDGFVMNNAGWEGCASGRCLVALGCSARRGGVAVSVSSPAGARAMYCRSAGRRLDTSSKPTTIGDRAPSPISCGSGSPRSSRRGGTERVFPCRGSGDEVPVDVRVDVWIRAPNLRRCAVVHCNGYRRQRS